MRLSLPWDFHGCMRMIRATEKASITAKSVMYWLNMKAIGLMDADNPKTHKMLKIFEPIIFPIDISISFFIAAATDAANSGRLVPSATIVNPITLSLTPIAWAREVAPSTRISAP